jgi:ribosomal protein S18 acetylase RimI-like enzyme
MGDALEIRPAEPRDARAFLEFWTAIVAEERFVRSEEVHVPARAYRRRFRQRSGLETHIVALEGDRLIGHVNVQRERHPVTHHVASLSIAVAADARGRGIGRRLMEEAIAWAKRVGIEKLVLSVYPHNEAAISLYRSFGFVDEGRLARHSRKSYGYEDEILMAVWIGSEA